MNTKTLVLVNPQARNGKLGKKWPEKEKEVLGALGQGPVQVAFTTATERGSGIVKKALLEGIKRIVVVGGDGTLSESIQGFFSDGKPIASDAVLAVLPAGRGDDFFKTIANRKFYSGQSAWNFGLELLRSGKPKAIDVGKLHWIGPGEQKHRYWINIASFGLPGLVVKRVHARKDFFGRSFVGGSAWTYAFQSVAAFLEYKPFSVHVKVDGKSFYQGDLQTGFILNGRFNAGGVCWSSTTQLDDGFFDLLMMKPASILSQSKNMIQSLFTPWSQVSGVLHAQARQVEVSIQGRDEKPHPFFEIDGELLERPETRGAIFEILPRTIHLLT